MTGEGRAADREPGQGGARVSLLDKARWMTQVRRDGELTDAAFRLAALVCDLVSPSRGFCYAGQAYMAEQGATTERAVRNHLRALVERGHLAVKRRGRAGASHYFLVQKDGAEAPEPDRYDRNGGAAHSDDGRAYDRNGGAGQNPPPDNYDRNGSVVMTGTAVPVSKQKNKRSCSAALRRAGRPRECRVDEGSCSAVPPDAAAVALRRALDARWTAAVGPDLAGGLGSTDPLHRAIASGEVTAEDVDAGIADWRARGTAPPRGWGFFVRWAATAAARRMDGGSGAGRPSPARPDRFDPFDDPPVPPGSVRLEGGAVRTLAFVREAVERWHAGFAWPPELGSPPDDEFASVPEGLRGPRHQHRRDATEPAETVV